MIIRVRNKLPPAQSDAHLKEQMKLAMAKRYNVANKALDLSKFHTAVELKDIFCSLAVLRIMLAAIDVIAETVPDLEALDLSDNRIHLLHHLKCLATKLPNLKILHLANNKIRSSNALDALRDSKLVDIVLNGNPLKDSLDEEGVYVSEIRKKFPKLERLDLNDLPPQMGFDVSDDVTMPIPKEVYLCNPNGKDIVRQFLEQYFTIFDSNNRQPLLDAYHEDAMFSLTANHNSQKGLRLGSYMTHNRNILRNNNIESSCRYLKRGRLPVVSLLSELPPTQHDPKSFAVDLLCFTPNSMQITVTGIFREQSKYIRSFQRTLIVVPGASGGLCIRNELLTISHATVAQIKSAFQTSETSVTPVSSTALLLPMQADVPHTMEVVDENVTKSTISTVETTKLAKIKIISQRSKMNLEWSEKCLAETNWDLDRAMFVFSEFNKSNQIPSEAFAKIDICSP